MSDYSFTGTRQLDSVYADLNAIPFLYELLSQRDIDIVSLSHRVMPTIEKHIDFYMSKPYVSWYVIKADGIRVGTIYLTHKSEIGIDILKSEQRKGHGEWAVSELMRIHPIGFSPFLANVNPKNTPSLEMFRKLGFADFQMTLRYNVAPGKMISVGGLSDLPLRGSGTGLQTALGPDEVPAARRSKGFNFPPDYS